MKNKLTCILLFSRSAASESKRKQLTMDHSANAQLHDVLYNRVVNTISKSSLPVLRIDEHQQVGNTFGERFYNAIAIAFNCGFENVIAVGSDCPSLRLADIQYAQQELKAGRICLGPSVDGGVYLMSISKTLFTSSFKQLPWRTATLANKLCNLFTALGAQVSFLAKKQDVDNKTQLNTIAYFLIKQLGINTLLFRSDTQSQVEHVLPLIDRLYDERLSLRGPPSLSQAA